MSRELWLLRHGKSDRDTDVADFDRPLKKRGMRAAQNIGAWMKEHELIPDMVLASPAKRALATAIRVCEELGVNSEAIHHDMRLYASGVESLQSVLSECPKESRRVLLVGHNPELEQFLIEMVGSASLYASGAESLQSVSSAYPKESRRVLLVGHNPVLERFLVEMRGGANLPYKKKLMPTAALARMEMPDDWTQLESGCAKLLAITYAKTLFDES